MEESPERAAELRRRMEKERQRERHLAIRRKNYHLRKQRAINNAAIAAAPFTPPFILESSAVAGDDELQGSTSLEDFSAIASVNADPKEINVIQNEKDNNFPTKEIKLFGKSIFVPSS